MYARIFWYLRSICLFSENEIFLFILIVIKFVVHVDSYMHNYIINI